MMHRLSFIIFQYLIFYRIVVNCMPALNYTSHNTNDIHWYLEKQRYIEEKKNENYDKISNSVEELSDETIKKENIPQYIATLYRKLSKKEHVGERLFHYGNTIRSFSDQGSVQDERNFNHYLFNVSVIDGNVETLKKAEIHLYKYPANRRRNSYSNVVQIDVTDICSRRIASSKIVMASSYGWQVFPVTSTVLQWIQGSNKNCHQQGFRITFTSLYGEKTRCHLGTKASRYHEPILVTYTKDEKELTISNLFENLKKKKKDEKSKTEVNYATSQSYGSHRNDLQEHNTGNDNNFLHNRVRRRATNIETCHLDELEVPVKDISWNYIISPETLKINRCKGKCLNLPSKQYQQTNHAIAQAMYAFLTKKVDYPCCAPKSFKPITALIKLDHVYDQIKIVKFDEIAVESCKCL